MAKLLRSQIQGSCLKRKVEADSDDQDEESGFGSSYKAFISMLENSEKVYQLAARIYAEQTLTLSLRQVKADPSKTEKSRILVRDTLVFLQKISAELESSLQPALFESASAILLG